MAKAIIRPSKLRGRVLIPPSKSHTLRAMLFALMAKGTSEIHRYLKSPDTNAMANALANLGAKVTVSESEIVIQGTGGQLKAAEDVIDCGNSGQVLRFIGALSALSPSYTVLTGDHSIRHKRPIAPLLDALEQLGAMAVSSRLDGYAPIIIRGPLKGGLQAKMNGEDSQPVSALLIAGAFVPLELTVVNPGEKPWIDLTLSWLKKFDIRCEREGHTHYRTKGGAKIDGFKYTVPGDFSSAAFPLAAALATQSELILEGLDPNDVQGDKEILPALKKMGAQFDFGPKELAIKKGGSLKGQSIDINNFIDALPILAVIGCFAEGTTHIGNAAIARAKESDRIHTIAHELKRMGANIEEKSDGLLIHHSPLKGASLNTYHDHRLVMALSVAALGATGESTIHGIEAADKSYPQFFETLRSLGAQIEVVP